MKYWIDKNILYKYQHKKWFWKYIGRFLGYFFPIYWFQVAHNEHRWFYPYQYGNVIRDDYYLTLKFCEEMYEKFGGDDWQGEMAIFETVRHKGYNSAGNSIKWINN